MDDQQIKALTDAADVLETEADQLNDYMEKTLKTDLTLRTQEVRAIDPTTPHRVVIAIRNERDRLRYLANVLRGLRPKEKETDA